MGFSKYRVMNDSNATNAIKIKSNLQRFVDRMTPQQKQHLSDFMHATRGTSRLYRNEN